MRSATISPRPRHQSAGSPLMVSSKSADEGDASLPHACPCCQPQLQFAVHRINQDLSRRGFIAGAGASLASLGLFPTGARAAPPPSAAPIVLGNFMLFDGKSKDLR